jgi:hypothetical protein
LKKQLAENSGGKEIDLTKDGFPNKRQLNKVQRRVIDEIKEARNNEEIEQQKREIYRVLGVEIE